MNRLEQSPLHGSVLALAVVAVALSISLAIRPYLEPGTFLLCLEGVGLSPLIVWAIGVWRKSRGLLVSTLNSIADAVVATDRKGRVTFLNPVAEALTGWTAVEARGKAVED